MHKGPSPKRKSQKRFEQLNHLCDNVIPTIPPNQSSHRAALLLLFRHASGNGGFKVSAGRLAKQLGVSERRARKVIDDLRKWGLIQHLPNHDTPHARAHRFTFQPCQTPQAEG